LSDLTPVYGLPAPRRPWLDRHRARPAQRPRRPHGL